MFLVFCNSLSTDWSLTHYCCYDVFYATVNVHCMSCLTYELVVLVTNFPVSYTNLLPCFIFTVTNFSFSFDMFGLSFGLMYLRQLCAPLSDYYGIWSGLNLLIWLYFLTWKGHVDWRLIVLNGTSRPARWQVQNLWDNFGKIWYDSIGTFGICSIEH